MSYKINKLPKSEIEILFEIPPEELEKFKKEALSHLSENLKVEGFRPGHVPQDIAKQKVGEMEILGEAAELAVKENYKKAVSESGIYPIGQPEVEIKKLAPGNSLEFSAKVAVMPEIKLPDYKKIAESVRKNEIKVEEQELEDSLLWLRKSRAKFSLKGSPSQKGDFVDIEYSSPTLEGGKKYQDAFILGEGKFLAGFEDNLQGLKDGGEKKFTIKFPEDYSQKDLASKSLEFDVKMKSVQKIELPEVTDEWAKGLGNFEGTEALKKNIHEGLTEEKEKAESDRIRNEMLDKIAEEAKTEIPEVLIKVEERRILQDLKERVAQGLQMSFDDYLKKTNKTEKELLDSFSEQAQKRVKYGLVLKEIAKLEGMEATPSEIKEETDVFLKRYPDVKNAQSQFDPERLKEYIEEAIVNEKTFKFLESLIK